MEDTLRDDAADYYENDVKVLILVLMEDTLRESSGRRSKKPIKS